MSCKILYPWLRFTRGWPTKSEEPCDQLVDLSTHDLFVDVLPIEQPDVESHKVVPAILFVHRPNNPRTLETVRVALLRDWPDQLICGVCRGMSEQ